MLCKPVSPRMLVNGEIREPNSRSSTMQIHNEHQVHDSTLRLDMAERGKERFSMKKKESQATVELHIEDGRESAREIESMSE
jgi:hypothetical protein